MELQSLPIAYSALLLDSDGVLVDSQELTDRALRVWAAEIEVDADLVLKMVVGRRMADVAPSLVAAGRIEGALAEFRRIELSLAREARPCPGALELVRTLHGSNAKWAIVTSAERAVAWARLAAAGLRRPPVIVAADDVQRGKPEPDGYVLAANLLGVAPGSCLAVDDRPIGVAAARAAGAAAIRIDSTSASSSKQSVIRSLDEIDISVQDEKIIVMSRVYATSGGRHDED